MTNGSSAPVTRREIFAWALFDFANSSYTTIVVTVVFSVYFTKLVAGDGRFADGYWSLGVALSSFLVVLLSPLAGAIADGTGRKKRALFVTYAVCVAATASLAMVTPGKLALGIALFVLSNVAFSLGENFIAAFLPEISTPRTIGRISGIGWGLGYLGGLASLLLVRPLLSGGFTVENAPRIRISMLITAGFFLLAGIPTFLWLRERAIRGPARSLGSHVLAACRRLRATAAALGQFRELVRFLVAFFVFSCGLTTVIAFSAIYAEKTLGFTAGELVALFLTVQVSAALGALGFGFLQDRIGARRTIQVSLCLWIAVACGAYCARDQRMFMAVVLLAGLGIGSLQSASRALVGLLSPASKTAEFFGFWGLAGKAAYVLGPAVFGVVSSAFASQRVAILSTVVFFALGLALVAGIDEQRGHDAARAWGATASPTPDEPA